MDNLDIINDYKLDGFDKVRWQTPANIAFVKYWGKRDFQLPSNPSLSLTLENSYTDTTIYFKNKEQDSPRFSFYFENKQNIQFEEKIKKYMGNISQYFDFFNDYDLVISSFNTFPHSAGIASSASSMASIALCLISIEKKLNNKLIGFEDFYQKASVIARMGSGSASRSIYGGFTVWGTHQDIKNSDDNFAVRIEEELHPNFQNLRDTVLIVSNQSKKVSSTVGHSLMKNHPYAETRFKLAYDNLSKIYSSLLDGDLDLFINILEAEALSLHGLMMTSNPGFILMEPNSIELINKIRDIRNDLKIPIGFTLDAGPNVHLIYPDSYKEQVKEIVSSELSKYCQNSKWIDDYLGNGPKQII